MFFPALTASVAPLVVKIQQHPFNQELAAGTLSSAVFNYYLTQDALYLAEFTKVLALIATKLNAPHCRQFLEFALGAVQAEQELHAVYLTAASRVTAPSPACFMYSHYLLSTASTAAVEVAVASVAPCFWLYQLIGTELATRPPLASQNPYQAWIDLYASPAFASAAQALIATLETLAAQTGEQTRSLMRATFRRSTELEWSFWDSAYRQETWPLA